MCERATGSQAARCSWSSRSEPGSEELLELHRSAHVALDLQLPGHVGARRVLLAGDDLLERLLGGRDDHVGVAAALADADLAVVDVDLPLSGALDVEDVRVAHARGLRGVGLRLEVREEILDGSGHHTLLGSVIDSRFKARVYARQGLRPPVTTCAAARDRPGGCPPDAAEGVTQSDMRAQTPCTIRPFPHGV